MIHSKKNQKTLVKLKDGEKRLTRHQKEAIGLLQIGTFLEYFDLMLYVHMAVLLNELFSLRPIPIQKLYCRPLLFALPMSCAPLELLSLAILEIPLDENRLSFSQQC